MRITFEADIWTRSASERIGAVVDIDTACLSIVFPKEACSSALGRGSALGLIVGAKSGRLQNARVVYVDSGFTFEARIAGICSGTVANEAALVSVCAISAAYALCLALINSTIEATGSIDANLGGCTVVRSQSTFVIVNAGRDSIASISRLAGAREAALGIGADGVLVAVVGFQDALIVVRASGSNGGTISQVPSLARATEST